MQEMHLCSTGWGCAAADCSGGRGSPAGGSEGSMDARLCARADVALGFWAALAAAPFRHGTSMRPGGQYSRRCFRISSSGSLDPMACTGFQNCIQ